MVWEIEQTGAFDKWWRTLTEGQQDDVAHVASLLADRGPALGHPYSSSIHGSKHGHMRELRVQSKGKPIRVFYAFDPRRCAILLIGGDKTGKDRFYKAYLPVADQLYDEHLALLKAKEGKRK